MAYCSYPDCHKNADENSLFCKQHQDCLHVKPEVYSLYQGDSMIGRVHITDGEPYVEFWHRVHPKLLNKANVLLNEKWSNLTEEVFERCTDKN